MYWLQVVKVDYGNLSKRYEKLASLTLATCAAFRYLPPPGVRSTKVLLVGRLG
jgi:hypothetical protein